MTRDMRALLDEMVSEPDTENHGARLRVLAREFPHTIDILQSSQPRESYNCVLHALGLHDYEVNIPTWYAKTGFVEFLIGNHQLVSCAPRASAIVAWSYGGRIKHVGRLLSPIRAVSKWGTGLLFAHGLNEVPERYGNVSGFYAPIDPALAYKYLESFLSPIQ
jgi:hypothetical protein